MQKAFADSFDSSAEEQQNDNYDVIGVAGTPSISENQLGSHRTVSSVTAKEWIFQAVTGVGILASCTFAVYFLVSSEGAEKTADFTLALLLLLNSCFTAYYLVDGVFTERAYELLVLVGTVLLVTVYLVANFVYTQGWESPVKIARLATAGLLGPISVALGCAIVYEYLSSGNFIFRKVGADSSLQRLCARLFVTESVVKFDLQSTLSVVLLVAKSGALDLFEGLTLGLGIGFSLVWSALVVVAMRLENYSLTIGLLIAGFAQPAYMTFVVIVKVDHLVNDTLIPVNADFSNSLPGVSLITSLFALILRFVLFTLMILVMRNYGQGLRRKLMPPILRRLTRSQYDDI